MPIRGGGRTSSSQRLMCDSAGKWSHFRGMLLISLSSFLFVRSANANTLRTLLGQLNHTHIWLSCGPRRREKEEMMFHGDQRSFAREQERCLVTVVWAPLLASAQNIISFSFFHCDTHNVGAGVVCESQERIETKKKSISLSSLFIDWPHAYKG